MKDTKRMKQWNIDNEWTISYMKDSKKMKNKRNEVVKGGKEKKSLQHRG